MREAREGAGPRPALQPGAVKDAGAAATYPVTAVCCVCCWRTPALGRSRLHQAPHLHAPAGRWRTSSTSSLCPPTSGELRGAMLSLAHACSATQWAPSICFTSPPPSLPLPLQNSLQQHSKLRSESKKRRRGRLGAGRPAGTPRYMLTPGAMSRAAPVSACLMHCLSLALECRLPSFGPPVRAAGWALACPGPAAGLHVDRVFLVCWCGTACCIRFCRSTHTPSPHADLSYTCGPAATGSGGIHGGMDPASTAAAATSALLSTFPCKTAAMPGSHGLVDVQAALSQLGSKVRVLHLVCRLIHARAH